MKTPISPSVGKTAGIFLITAVIGAISIAVFLERRLEANALRHWEANQSVYAVQMAKNVYAKIQSAKYELMLVAAHPAFSTLPHVDQINLSINGIPEALDQEKRKLLDKLQQKENGFSVNFVLKPNGDHYLSHPFSIQKSLSKYNLSDRPYFKAATQRKEVVISDSFLGASNIPAVAINVPILNAQGDIVAHLGGGFFLHHLSKGFQKEKIGEFDRVFLVDNKGYLIADTNINQLSSNREKMAKHPIVSDWLQQAKSIPRQKWDLFRWGKVTNPVTNTTSLNAFVPLPNGWALGVSRDEADFRNVITQHAYRTAGWVGFLLLFIGTVASLIIFGITKRESRAELELEAQKKETEKSHHQWRDAFDTVSSLIFLHDSAFRILQANHAFYEACSKNESDVIGIEYWKCLPFGNGPLQCCLNALEEGGEESDEIVTLADGTIFQSRAFAIRDENGGYDYSIHILEDITLNKRAERILANSAAHFKTLFENAPAGYQSLNEEGMIIEVNQSWLEIFGYDDKNGIIGHWFSEFLPPDQQQLFRERFPLFKRSGTTHSAEFRMIKKDGLSILVSFEGRVHYNENGKFSQTHCMLTDITEKRAQELEIQRQKQLLETIINAIPDIICLKDGEGRWLMANEYDLDLFQLTGVDYQGKTDAELAPYSDFYRDAFLTCMDSDEIAWRERRASRSEEVIPQPDGISKIFDIVKIPLFDADGSRHALVVTGRDMTDRLKAEKRLHQAATVFESASEGIIITDADAKVLAVNKAFTEITGYTQEEVQGNNPKVLQSQRHDRSFYTNLWSTLLTTGRWQGEIWNRNKLGEIYPELLTISSIMDKENNTTGYVGIFSDISSLKHSQEQLDYLAHHDPLTDLPNRLLLQARLEHSLAAGAREKRKLALLLLDLDGFKKINDSLGHPTGDKVLIQIAQTLKKRVRAQDTLARIGGDEFIIVMDGIKENSDVIHHAEEILTVLSEPIIFDNHELLITASIGISLYPQDASDIDTLMRNADSAMYKAKEQGRNSYQFYSPEYTAEAFERVRLEVDIRRGLNNEEFEVYYQPQIELATGRMAGAEALVRWNHPEMGLVSPAQFIPVAEQSGQIVELGDYVLRHACRQWIAWQANGLTLETLAVNLSGRQLTDSAFVERVDTILRETGVPPSHIELEVTEGYLMREVESSIKILRKLRELGVTLSIDDFGTGYSSLSYLKRLPVTRLKIDQSFVRDIPKNQDDEAIAKAVIALGHSMNLEIIAEGVETDAQRAFMMQERCDQAQGYLFSRPVPADEFEGFWRSHEQLHG